MEKSKQCHLWRQNTEVSAMYGKGLKKKLEGWPTVPELLGPSSHPLPRLPPCPPPWPPQPSLGPRPKMKLVQQKKIGAAAKVFSVSRKKRRNFVFRSKSSQLKKFPGIFCPYFACFGVFWTTVARRQSQSLAKFCVKCQDYRFAD